MNNLTKFFLVLSVMSLLLLAACSNTQESDLIECWDGSLADSQDLCPAELEPEPEPVIEDGAANEVPEETGPELVSPREVVRSVLGENVEDGLFLGQEYCDYLDNSELDGLFDGDLRVDTEEYNAEEQIGYCLTLDASSTGDSDLGSDVAVTYNQGDIVYRFKIEDLDTADISSKDSLKLDFLGLPAQVTKWESNKVTFIHGAGQYVEEGQTFEDIRLVAVADGRAVVEHVEENGFTIAVDEHDVEVVGKREVYVDDVLYLEKEGSTSAVFMYVSAEETALLRSVSNGEEYDNDHNWDWVIETVDGDSYLGLEWDVDASDADDEHAVFIEHPVTLVADWLEMALEADDLSEQRDYEFEIEQEDVNGTDLTGFKVRGDFDTNLGEVEASDDGVFLDLVSNLTWVNRDSEWEVASSVEFKDSGVALTHLGGVVSFDLVNATFVNNVMTDLEYNGKSLTTEEDDFLAVRGYVLEDPEGNFEDSQLRVEGFPEDQEEYQVVWRTPVEA